MLGDQAARGAASELESSYELCAEMCRRHFWPVWTAARTLPAGIRAHVLAVCGYAGYTDRLADEGVPAEGEDSFARWRAQTLAEMEAGHSDHPVRRGLVDTMRMWGLDAGVLREYLDTVEEDSAGPPMFATEADQRRYLRGISGTLSELWAPLLQPQVREAAQALSLLGEVCQLVDICEDFPTDLAAGRCYLPGEDLDRLGLTVEDLRRGERREELDALIEMQVARGRELVQQAAPVAGMVPAPCQMFLDGLTLAADLVFDEAERLGGRVLAEGVQVKDLRTPPPPTSDSVVTASDSAVPDARSGVPETRSAAPDTCPAVPGTRPDHVAVIMDGNRRWARQRGLSAKEGHRAGGRGLVRLVDSAQRLGVGELSVFAFSTENWRRSQEELADLFDAMAERLTWAAEWLHDREVRVRWGGRRDGLEESVASALAMLESLTSNNTGLSLNVCVDYGGQEELVGAARALAAEAVAGTIRPQDIGPADLARSLYLPGLPPVDLLIRTSGEQRISNFLLWHLAYAELVFETAEWPDFGPRHLQAAVAEYATRQRRFGSDMSRPAHLPGPAAAH